jgi:hypothetical protein
LNILAIQQINRPGGQEKVYIFWQYVKEAGVNYIVFVGVLYPTILPGFSCTASLIVSGSVNFCDNSESMM